MRIASIRRFPPIAPRDHDPFAGAQTADQTESGGREHHADRRRRNLEKQGSEHRPGHQHAADGRRSPECEVSVSIGGEDADEDEREQPEKEEAVTHRMKVGAVARSRRRDEKERERGEPAAQQVTHLVVGVLEVHYLLHVRKTA